MLQGLDAALERKKRERPPIEPILDGEKEARLIALACSQPPKGRSRWTLELLAGTAANFLFLEPLTGRRKVHVRERRTAVDWAYEIQELLEVDYPDAQVVVLVCDNLSTHTIASLARTLLGDSDSL